MKTCTKCEKTLPYTEFSKASKSKDGHDWRCKKCKSKDKRKYLLSIGRGNGKIGGHNKIELDEDRILRLYLEEKKAPKEIIAILDLDCTEQTIYSRLREKGVLRSASEAAPRLVGEQNPNWKGGYLTKEGYVRICDGEGKQVYEHRLVMEKHLGRRLTNEEVVHHINGDRADNRIENLELLSSHSEHMKLHMDSEEASKRGKSGAEKKWVALKAVGVEVG